MLLYEHGCSLPLAFFLPRRLLATLVKNFLAGLGGWSSGTVTQLLGGSLSGVKPWNQKRGTGHYRKVEAQSDQSSENLTFPSSKARGNFNALWWTRGWEFDLEWVCRWDSFVRFLRWVSVQKGRLWRAGCTELPLCICTSLSSRESQMEGCHTSACT